MSFRSLLLSNPRTLTPSEQRVVDVLMRDLRESVFMPAAQIATAAGVHESTVIRLARKLGYAGFAELREAMREDVKALEGGTARLVKLNESRGYDLNALVQAEATALLKLPDHIPQKDLDDAARQLLDARRIYIYGNHYAAPLVTFLDRRLRMLGLLAHPIPATAERDLGEHLISVGDGDVLFAFALRRVPPSLNRMLAHVGNVGAGSIVLTDVHGLPLASAPDRLLVAPRGVDDDFRTQVVPHLVCYALQLALYHLAPERCEVALENLENLHRSIAAPSVSRERR
ncbi:MurR/RpiR family transcriptional regulator [Acrocarpospora macrocephala]|uniref:MurR/RpiR family transcriptional regulator n=1 Tax=Acrocarpospora macrocephala TaxID=150177 RepID=UPI0012D30EE9|nr:MurR/RpiR family transcriptional regulator [Acrocarpospora macrocephala]